MNKEGNAKISYFRVSVALSCAGMFLTALLVIIFKRYHIYEYDYEFGRQITLLFFIAIVILPLSYCSLELFYAKCIRLWVCKISQGIEQHRIKKHGRKKLLRERRINKVMSSAVACIVLMNFFGMQISVLIFIGIYCLFWPGFDLGDESFTLVRCIFVVVIPVFVSAFACLIIYMRFFVRKKGKQKALKYAVNLKRRPTLIGRLWLKAYGINREDIQNYFEKLN